jgi:hypothetical protein
MNNIIFCKSRNADTNTTTIQYIYIMHPTKTSYHIQYYISVKWDQGKYGLTKKAYVVFLVTHFYIVLLYFNIICAWRVITIISYLI